MFKDIGHPDPDTHLLKAEIVTGIDEVIRHPGLKQIEAPKLLGLLLPAVTLIVRGSFREFPTERLLRLLMALRRDVQMVTV